MLNVITVMGRLTSDPELRCTAGGTAVATFTIACERDYSSNETAKKETDFIDCVAWRKTAEFVSKYFAKGSAAVVTGRLQIRNWEDKNGNKRRSAEVMTDNIYFAGASGKKHDDEESTGSIAGTESSGFSEESFDDGQLPF